MKGKKLYSKGVSGVSIELSLNEIFILHDLSDKILHEEARLIGENKDRTKIDGFGASLAKIMMKMTNNVLDLSTVYQNMVDEEDIFKDNRKENSDGPWND